MFLFRCCGMAVRSSILPSSQEHGMGTWGFTESSLFQLSHTSQVWGGMERGIGAFQICLPWRGKSWGEEF